MSYELSFKHEPDYLYVQATGIRTVENIIALVRDFFTVADKHGYSKILLDIRGITEGLKPAETYNLGSKDLAKLWRGLGKPKVAVFDLETNREQDKFMEDVLANAGVNFRFFFDVNEAMESLGVSKSPASE
ncbi:MAG: hypothetical protein GY861_04340 [bacterium]|nr:hypothetical protein [bacterium]